jgi:hypothetical protein
MNFFRGPSKNFPRSTSRFQVILMCVVFFLLIAGLGWVKVQAYGGDPSCLIVRCVKVINK